MPENEQTNQRLLSSLQAVRLVDVYEVVKRLIGPIQPVGESHTDKDRLENMKEYTELARKMVIDINTVAFNKDSHMHSVRLVGEEAHEFCRELEDYIE